MYEMILYASLTIMLLFLKTTKQFLKGADPSVHQGCVLRPQWIPESTELYSCCIFLCVHTYSKAITTVVNSEIEW